jgi:DNA-binding XRE family transcriptional regulator
MATLSKKENIKASQISPADIGPEDVIITWLLRRFQELPRESFKDTVELIKIYTNPETPTEEHCEIYKTIREILFPELNGIVREVNISEKMPPNVQSRANWIGKKVKEYRERKGLTQAELADKGGLQQSQISRLEAGEHSPSFKTLDKIAKALEVLIGDLDPSH